MNLSPIKTRIFKKNEDLYEFFTEHFDLSLLQENSVIIISSKIVALSQNRISKKTLREEVLSQADEILNDCGSFLLTVKDGIIIPNAGIDQSNSKTGEIILWPKNPEQEALIFREKIQQQTGLQNIGVIISDSRVTPRRKGTVGVALAWSGIWGVKDERGKKDLFGRPLEVSAIHIADNMVSAGEILMGQSNESTPFIHIENIEKKLFTPQQQPASTAFIGKKDDLFQI